VLGVDVGADAAVALGLGDDVGGEGGLAGALRAPMPRARSRARAPVGTVSMAIEPLSPIFMTAPVPNCFSIWLRARSRALPRPSPSTLVTGGASVFFRTLLMVLLRSPGAVRVLDRW
jgi:hypothetical protein